MPVTSPDSITLAVGIDGRIDDTLYSATDPGILANDVLNNQANELFFNITSTNLPAGVAVSSYTYQFFAYEGFGLVGPFPSFFPVYGVTTATLALSGYSEQLAALPEGATLQSEFAYSIHQANISLQAGADYGTSNTSVVAVTFVGINDAPTIATPIADQSAKEGQLFSFVLPDTTFADVDHGDSLTLATSTLPAWLSFNPATGTFSGTPGANDQGFVDITVTATDTGHLSTSDSFRIAVADAAAPTIGAVTPNPVEQGQTTVIATVTPAVAGDTLTLTEMAGAGTLSLGAVHNGTQQVIYTAPGSVPMSTTDAVSYTVAENSMSAAGAASVQLDAGPSVAPQTPSVMENSQTTIIGTVTPGLAGDTLTLTQAPGSLGTLSLGAVQANGTQQVIYTAPATVSASAVDMVGYTASDQHDDVAASGSANVQLDAGPSLKLLPFVLGAANQAVTIATATPGLQTDTLGLVVSQAPQSGALSLHGTSVQFTPTSSILLQPVSFSFALTDELGGTTPVYTVIAGKDIVNSVTGNFSGNTDIGLGNGINQIKLAGSGNVVDAGNGANVVTGGVSNNTVILGNGLDSVTLTGGNNAVTLGNGLDNVKLSGGENMITLGNGADAVSVEGSGNEIKLGNGTVVVHGGSDDTIDLAGTNLTLYGTDETVFVGNGHAILNDYSAGLDLKIGPRAGSDILSHFSSDPTGIIELIGGIGGFTTTADVLSALKPDGHGGTLLSFGPGSSLDFAGVAPSHLHASNFQIG